MAPLGHMQIHKRKYHGTFWPIKRQLTVYGTSRPLGINKKRNNFYEAKTKMKKKNENEKVKTKIKTKTTKTKMKEQKQQKRK